MAIEDDDNIKGLLSGWGLSGKPCDSCHSSTSLLFCRQHSAYLCSPCDTDIHRHNPHERVWVCEVCEQAPAAFTCKADAAALCVSCDRDIHSANPLSQRHQRLPIVPFLQTPAASGSFIVPNDDDVANGRAVDAWMIPDHKLVVSPAAAGFVFPSDFGPCNSDLSSSTGFGGFEQQCEIRDVVHEEAPHLNVFDSTVPMATTNQNSIHYSQQREKKFGTTTTTTTTNCFEIDFTQSKLSPFNYSSSICQSHSVSSSDVGVVPDGISNSMSEVSNFPFTKSIDGGIGSVMTEPPVQLSRAEREARVMRYREKRKNRKFEKTIRYASRKAYAESRPRIKGRFAKRNSDPDEDAEIFSISGGGFVMVDHGGYGVVPSF